MISLRRSCPMSGVEAMVWVVLRRFVLPLFCIFWFMGDPVIDVLSVLCKLIHYVLTYMHDSLFLVLF